jgi:formylglycine-generating enzyme required for sulfatase activity
MPSRYIPIILLALTMATPAAGEEPPATRTLDLGGGVGLDLVLVKKGTFRQGSPADEPGRGDDESPREVTLTRDFYLGKYPVTRGQFNRFVQETGYRTEAEKGPSGGFGLVGTGLAQRPEFTWRNPGFSQTDDHPVTVVTYDDARAFLAWLSRKTSRRCELPTEAQYEYACRAGTNTPFYNGRMEKDAADIAWFKDNAGSGTKSVGAKKPNAWGLDDMAGNVFEWCRDWYTPYPPGPATDPEQTQPERSGPQRRVLRGGSWLRDVSHCRSAARYRNTPSSRNADNGFRVLVAVEAEEAPGQGAAPAPVPPPAEQEKPPGPFAPPPVPVESSQTTGGLGLPAPCCCGTVALGGVVALVALLRGAGRSRTYEDSGVVRGPTRRPVPRAAPRTAADGFWLDDPNLPAGSTVRYRYRLGGQEHTGEATVAPGPQGQFIYTGGMPSVVEILDVFPPGGTPGLGLAGPPPGPIVPPPPRPSPPPPRPSPPPFTGYPSAY